MTTPNTQGASWEERERVKMLYRPVIDLDHFNARTEPNFEAADKALDDLLSKERAEGERRERERIEQRARELMPKMYETIDNHKRIRSEGTRERVKILLTALFYGLFSDPTLPADSTEETNN